MKRMSYTVLMSKVENNKCYVTKWANGKGGQQLARVKFLNANGSSEIRLVEVTNMPVEVSA